MKILADQNIPFVKDAFADIGEVVAIDGRQIGLTAIEGAGVLLVRSITRVGPELLGNTPVQFVGTATIGTDHIDTPFLRQRGIAFASAPGSNAESVAQYVVSALLHTWEGLPPVPRPTLGIIGVGNVGSRVLRVGAALGLRCLLNDPPKESIGQGSGYVSLDRLLSESDIVTLHVPLIVGDAYPTCQMVNEGFLSRMKRGAVLINTSRGAVVDEQALRRLRSRLGGVILDVWEREPSISSETLGMADIATPHVAGYSFEGKVRGTAMICAAAHKFFSRVSSWSADEVLGGDLPATIDLRGALSPVLDAVRHVYPITRDDEQLRAILKVTEKGRSAFFDRLRRDYPVRREFGAYRVIGLGENDPSRVILSRLGFDVGE